jgi:hypothetical protein
MTLKETLSNEKSALRTTKSSFKFAVKQLNHEKAELERQNEEALEMASRATAEVVSLREVHVEAVAAQKEVERLLNDVKEKDREVVKYKDWIDQHKKKVCIPLHLGEMIKLNRPIPVREESRCQCNQDECDGKEAGEGEKGRGLMEETCDQRKTERKRDFDAGGRVTAVLGRDL